MVLKYGRIKVLCISFWVIHRDFEIYTQPFYDQQKYFCLVQFTQKCTTEPFLWVLHFWNTLECWQKGKIKLKGYEGKQKIDWRKDPEGRIDGGIARTAKSSLLISAFWISELQYPSFQSALHYLFQTLFKLVKLLLGGKKSYVFNTWCGSVTKVAFFLGHDSCQ